MDTLAELARLETILRADEKKRRIERVISAKEEQASAQGDNYSSSVMRVRMDVVLGSGRKCSKSVIVKRLPEGSPNTTKWLIDTGTFKREIEVMDIVLPAMEDLMGEKKDYRDVFWPRLIHYTPNSEVIIEDLKVYGYELGDRINGFTFEQSCLVLQQAARFHAMSVPLVRNGIIDPSIHLEHVLFHSSDMVKNYIQASFQTISHIILRDWGPEWNEIGMRLGQIVPSIPDRMKNLGKLDKTRFNVLNHGDLWAPNILFKYGRKKLVPESMRLIDYQMTFYTTYAFDLNHFLYSSVAHSVRESHMNHLLKVYHSSLAENLSLYGINSSEIPSLVDVLREMERTSFIALLALCMILPVLMSPPEAAVDFEKLITPKQEIENMNENIFQSTEYVSILKVYLKQLSNYGVF